MLLLNPLYIEYFSPNTFKLVMLNPDTFVKEALNLTLITGLGSLGPRLSSYCHVPLRTGEESSLGIFHVNMRVTVSNSHDPPGGNLFACEELDDDAPDEDSAAKRRLSFDCIEPLTAVAVEPR